MKYETCGREIHLCTQRCARRKLGRGQLIQIVLAAAAVLIALVHLWLEFGDSLFGDKDTTQTYIMVDQLASAVEQADVDD